MIALYIILLTAGFVGLVKGADLFVDGSSGLARHFRVPGIIIGLTIVAFGTSAPELAVSTSAAIQGSNEMALSNVVDSNIFNLLMVLGVCAVIYPVPVDALLRPTERRPSRRETEGSNPFGSIQKDSPVLPGCLSVINLRIQVCDKASPLWSALNARPMDEHLSFILYLKASKTTQPVNSDAQIPGIQDPGHRLLQFSSNPMSGHPEQQDPGHRLLQIFRNPMSGHPEQQDPGHRLLHIFRNPMSEHPEQQDPGHRLLQFSSNPMSGHPEQQDPGHRLLQFSSNPMSGHPEQQDPGHRL